MHVPLSWLREYVPLPMPAGELAERLEHQRGRGEHDRAARAGRRGRQPRSLPRRQGPRGGKAPERGPAPALPGGRRGGRAAPDRLRRLELRCRRHRRGRASGREASRGRCAARRGKAARRGLAGNDPLRARARARRRSRRNHGAPRGRARDAARRRASARRSDHGGRADGEPRRSAVRLRRSRARLRRSSGSSSRRLPASIRSRVATESVDIRIDDLDGCPRYVGRVLSAASGSARRRPGSGRASRQRGCDRSPTSSTSRTTSCSRSATRSTPSTARSLAGDLIVVRRATRGEKLRTLDGVERELDEHGPRDRGRGACGRARRDHGRRGDGGARLEHRRSCSRRPTSSRSRLLRTSRAAQAPDRGLEPLGERGRSAARARRRRRSRAAARRARRTPAGSATTTCTANCRRDRSSGSAGACRRADRARDEPRRAARDPERLRLRRRRRLERDGSELAQRATSRERST